MNDTAPKRPLKGIKLGGGQGVLLAALKSFLRFTSYAENEVACQKRK